MTETEFKRLVGEQPWGSRFLKKVTFGATCWDWTGAVSPKGYGRVSVNGRALYPHRLIHEALIGPIPLGYQVDHVRAWGCNSRACVRPSHLEVVTSEENVRRSLSTPKTHCPRGHELSGNNLFLNRKGWRSCRTCARDSNARSTKEQKKIWRATYYKKKKEVNVSRRGTHCGPPRLS